MSSGEPRPRGMVLRSLIAAGVFLGAVLPGWVMAELVESWTGWPLLGWSVSVVWTGAAVWRLAPHVSYRRRIAILGAVPLLGWYLVCILAWRAALLPLRDWEPLPEETWRARWLTGADNAGLWRTDPVAVRPATKPRTRAVVR